MALTTDQVLAACTPLIGIGAAVHVLRPHSKIPISEGWSEAPVHTAASFASAYHPDENVGIRLGTPSKTGAGYMMVLDVDIRDGTLAPEAWAAFRKLIPDASGLPTVVSGSGGWSRHVYFFCPEAFRSKKLAHSKTFQMVLDPAKGREVKKYDWEIELFGTGKQVAAPPSVHPDTGLEYRWETPIDIGSVKSGIGPTIPASTVSSWGVRPDLPDDEQELDDDMLALVRATMGAPLDLTPQRIEKTLLDLPEDWVEVRDYWLTVGMALHHQFEGSDEGFSLWNEWSKQSTKFNYRDSVSVWRSFRNEKRKSRLTTFATLLKAAVPDYSDILGDTAPVVPGVTTKKIKKRRLTYWTPGQCAVVAPREYVIKGLLARGDIGCIFGPPGAGKSLIGPHLGYAVALGQRAFDMRTKQGGVWYIGAEDPTGLMGRIKALWLHLGDTDQFRLVTGLTDLMNNNDDLAELMEDIERERPALAFLDTLAMGFPGLEESDPVAMGRVIAVARMLAKFGAAVVLIHHDTKAEGGSPRGHGSLHAALDVCIWVRSDPETRVVRSTLTKNRNGPADRVMAFSIEVESAGVDEDGDPILLPRVSELTADDGLKAIGIHLTPSQMAVLNHAREMLRKVDSLAMIDLRASCEADEAVSATPNPVSRRKAFARALKTLVGHGLMSNSEGFIHLASVDYASVFSDLVDEDDDDSAQ